MTNSSRSPFPTLVSRTTRPDRSQAFTIIELLVVMAVIGVLAALIFPSLRGVRDQADATSCCSNLRQIGAALHSFANENDGAFPIAASVIARGAIDAATNKGGWTEQIEKYVGVDLRTFTCKSAAKNLGNADPYSYFLGTHAAMVETGDNSFAAVRISRISKLSQFILGGDATWGGFVSGDADKDDYTQDAAFSGNVTALHRKMVNILFADGSIRPYGSFNQNEMDISYDNPDATYP